MFCFFVNKFCLVVFDRIFILLLTTYFDFSHMIYVWHTSLQVCLISTFRDMIICYYCEHYFHAYHVAAILYYGHTICFKIHHNFNVVYWWHANIVFFASDVKLKINFFFIASDGESNRLVTGDSTAGSVVSYIILPSKSPVIHILL